MALYGDFQFMVDFTLPEVLTDEFMGLVPEQRMKVSEFFSEGKLLHYSLSLPKSKLWAVFSANSELEVMEMLAELPLTDYMDLEINPLTFYNALSPKLPAFSVN